MEWKGMGDNKIKYEIIKTFACTSGQKLVVACIPSGKYRKAPIFSSNLHFSQNPP